MSFVSNQTIKHSLNRECRQFMIMLPVGMPEAIEGRGMICRKVRTMEVELLASLLKAGEMRMARMMIRHLLCKCGVWQIAKAVANNLELRMRAHILIGLTFRPI